MATKIHGKDERGPDGKLKDRALVAKLKAEVVRLVPGAKWEPELLKVPR